jgi:UDP-glucuronate 4-epimerase
MKILLTGAAGFIGSHLSEKLLSLDHQVTGIDNFDPFYHPSIKRANLEKCITNPNFNLIHSDLSEIKFVINNHENHFDLVVHLAAKAGVRPSIENPQAYIDANIVGTFHVLEWMKNSGCKKMIFASSSSVYGNNKKIPFSESDPVDRVISPYAFTKKSCELMNHNYFHIYDLSIINLRFFTVYGPRQRPDLAIHKFFELLYNDEPISIFGDGTTGRDYTYINDTINGIVASVNRIMSEKKLFEIFNLGNSKPILLRDLVDNIEKVVGKKANKKFLPMQDGDVELTYADISLAKQVLGYNPATSLQEGLKNFKEWYENKKNLRTSIAL